MDGSIRDFQRHTSQFTPGKNFDASGAWGPWIVTADEVPDPTALELCTRVDGRELGKSDRLVAGAWLEVDLPDPADRAPAVVPEPVPGMRIVHDDEDVVVVDKPVGVAAHPSPGWTGPTVVGALAAAGYRISTSGSAERQGIVHRLDAGTSGLMAVAKSEHAYTVLKRAFKERTVEKVYHALVQGHPEPTTGTIDGR